MAHCAAGNCPCGTIAMSASLPTSLPFGSITRRCCISDRYGISRDSVLRGSEGAKPLRPLQFVYPRAPDRAYAHALEEHPVPQITAAGLRARALADQATAAALEADWPRAADLNQKLVDVSTDDLQARNRLGRALIELGRLEIGRASWRERWYERGVAGV